MIGHFSVIPRARLRWAFIIATFALAFCALSRPGLAIEPSLVFDGRTGEVIAQHRAGDSWHPASLTKLMTTYVTFHAIRAGRVKLDRRLKMSARAAKEPPSKIGYKPGTTFSVDFALRVLIVRSANDIAVALGEGVSGSLEKFVAEMNLHAKRLGMTGTHFMNPHGLHHAKQVTTARDMGILAANLFHEFPEYAYFFSLKNVKIGKRTLANRNKLLKTLDGADGMKTGFTCPSGFNLVASATRNNRKLIAVVMGRKSSAVRNDYTQKLLEGGYLRTAKAKITIGQIANTGSAPINMRQNVCNSDGITLTKVPELAGWGVLLGKFSDKRHAEAAIDRQLVLNPGILKSGKRGIARAPFSRKYMAVMWNLNKGQGKKFCKTVKNFKGSCELLSPAAFNDLQAQSVREAEQRRAKKKKKAKKKSTSGKKKSANAAANKAAAPVTGTAPKKKRALPAAIRKIIPKAPAARPVKRRKAPVR